MFLRVHPLFWLGMVVVGLFVAPEEKAVAQGDSALTGTNWSLVKFEGGDGKVLTPGSAGQYSLQFATGDSLLLKVDCNRGSGKWVSAGKGQVELHPMALTRAMCPSSDLNQRLPKDFEYVRSYVMKDGHLFLSLMADGGTYEFAPGPSSAATTVSDGDAAVPLEGTHWVLRDLGAKYAAKGVGPNPPDLTLDAVSHRATGSSGCNRYTGSYELSGEELAFGQIAGTMRACAAGMSVEKDYLQMLGQVKTWKETNDVLSFFDVNGKPVARYHAMTVK